MGFGRIVGQERAVFVLVRALGQGRLHHSLRFEGPDGTGKMTAAAAVARAINCAAPATASARSPFGGGGTVEGPDACGACPSCRRIPGAGEGGEPTHPDVHFMRPTGESRVVRIEEVRQLQSVIAYPPIEGKARVVIVEDAENVTEEASNALLKTLEEPPPRTHFILTTARPSRLLPTVRSRTAAVRFSALSREETELVARERCPTAGAEEVGLAAAMAGGSPGQAIALLEGGEAAGEGMALALRLDDAIGGPAGAIVELLDGAGLARESAGQLLGAMGLFYRDVAVRAAAGEGGELLLRSQAERVARRAGTMGPATACALCRRVVEGLRQLEMNVNPRMVVERIVFETRVEAR